jgi:anti-sigma regulatory factor (Ser/Thr protein kinase)
MKMTQIFTPPQFDYASILPFSVELENIRDAAELTLDFSKTEFASPVAILTLGCNLKSLIEYRKTSALVTHIQGISEDIPAHSYLGHLGFFDFIDVTFGKAIGEATGNDRYIPITKLSYSELMFEVSPPYKLLRHVIMEEAEKLAIVLSPIEADEGSTITLAYALREIIRNVFEHSKAREAYICGQRWSGGRVEIAIIDQGIGIFDSLKSAFGIKKPIDALELAIEPAISRTTGPKGDRNEHGNSGYGLYVLSRLGLEYGKFLLGSSDGCLRMDKNGTAIDDFAYKGTVVGLRLYSHPENFGADLEAILQGGEMEAYMEGRKVKPSSGTKEIPLSKRK